MRCSPAGLAGRLAVRGLPLLLKAHIHVAVLVHQLQDIQIWAQKPISSWIDQQLAGHFSAAQSSVQHYAVRTHNTLLNPSLPPHRIAKAAMAGACGLRCLQRRRRLLHCQGLVSAAKHRVLLGWLWCLWSLVVPSVVC